MGYLIGKVNPLLFMRPIHVLSVALICTALTVACQDKPPFSIRTITAGVTLSSLSDTATLLSAIDFLQEAKKEFTARGYAVQTLRIATQPLHKYLNGKSRDEALPFLVAIDRLMEKHQMILAIGPVMGGREQGLDIPDWAVKLIKATKRLSFSVSITDDKNGIASQAIHVAARTMVQIAANTPGGEGNFSFTACANCPAGIPFFPAAYHEGANSFALGIESPNILNGVFAQSTAAQAKGNLKMEMERLLQPLEAIAISLSRSKNWDYDGIDTSTAPGLGASIGQAIETFTGQPFGSPSTLSACAMITDVLKSINVKRCGYSGLMLPVIEDKVLAQRASEGRFSVQELLLYSSVSGTGLDVVPLPGETSVATLENLLTDVAALSLKYTAKPLSARLFLIPGKKAGEWVSFTNPSLTACRVMKVE